MYVCMCVCVYVCMYVCVYVCMYVCMYVCTYVCMYVCVYVCMCVCVRDVSRHIKAAGSHEAAEVTFCCLSPRSPCDFFPFFET